MPYFRRRMVWEIVKRKLLWFKCELIFEHLKKNKARTSPSSMVLHLTGPAYSPATESGVTSSSVCPLRPRWSENHTRWQCCRLTLKYILHAFFSHRQLSTLFRTVKIYTYIYFIFFQMGETPPLRLEDHFGLKMSVLACATFSYCQPKNVFVGWPNSNAQSLASESVSSLNTITFQLTLQHPKTAGLKELSCECCP